VTTTDGLKLPVPDLTDPADGPDAFLDLGNAVEDYLLDRILPPGITRYPGHFWGSVIGNDLSVGPAGVKEGDIGISSLLNNCRMIWTSSGWRQLTIISVNNAGGGINGFASGISGAGSAAHEGLRVWDTDLDRLFACTGGAAFTLIGGKPGSLLSAGATAQANWTLTSQSFRSLGNGMAYVSLIFQRTTSALTVTATGDVTNSDIALLPSGWGASAVTGLNSGGTGRTASYQIDNSRMISMANTTPGANIAIGDAMSVAGVYPLNDPLAV
jgi:hypothetical protein